MLSTALLLAASMVMGQADGPPEEPKNEHLLQFEPLIGEWKTDLASAVGEVSATRHAQWRWALGTHVIIMEWVTKKNDGTITDQWMEILHWDPSDRKVKVWGIGSGGSVPAKAMGTLERADDGTFLFESRGTWVSGAQHVAKLKIAPNDDGKSYTWGWSKVSGAGADNAGPYVFERIK